MNTTAITNTEQTWIANTDDVSPLLDRKLTAREKEIISLIRTGRSSLQIAKELFVAKRTVDFHLGRAYSKLGVDNRISAVNEAINRGEIELQVNVEQQVKRQFA